MKFGLLFGFAIGVTMFLLYEMTFVIAVGMMVANGVIAPNPSLALVHLIRIFVLIGLQFGLIRALKKTV